MIPIQCDIAPTAEDMVRGAEEELISRKIVKSGNVIGVISGTLGSTGSTNLMRLHTVGTDNISGNTAADRRKTLRSKPAAGKK